MALTSSFEHSSQELLALSICRDMAVLVVHKMSLEVSRGPGASLGGPKRVPGVARRGPGVPRACPCVPERPQASKGRAQEIPGIPGISRVGPGIPGVLFIKMILSYDCIISFRNMIP